MRRAQKVSLVKRKWYIQDYSGCCLSSILALYETVTAVLLANGALRGFPKMPRPSSLVVYLS